VKKKKKAVSFNEEEDVINPEDIDPSVGRFRNMIQTVVVIPNKVKIKFFFFILLANF
jgi:nuclear inhibitor of protein phosphatase 1